MRVATKVRGVLLLAACCVFSWGDAGAASRATGSISFRGTVTRSCALTVSAPGEAAAVGIVSIGKNTVTAATRSRPPSASMTVTNRSAGFSGPLSGSEPMVVTCS